ncbi:MAG: MBL fold metallo-hydrolase [Promethearchaeota archaeon]
MDDFIKQLSEEYKEIYFIQGQRDGRYPYSHSLLIYDCLIDTGISSGFIRKLKKKFSINKVILSHWHEDHISGNRLLPNAKYFAHKKDIPIIENVQKMYEYYFVKDKPEQIELFNTILEGLRLKDTKIEEVIKDNDIIKIGDNYSIKIIYTPGHTKGHCCFLELKSKIAFLADIDLSSFGPWYAGLDSNLIDFEESIKKILKYDIEIAITSHKGIIKGKSTIKEKLNEYKLILNKRDERILENLSELTPKNAEDLKGKNLIYNYYSEYKIYEVMAEKIMIQYHLNKLVKNRIIESKNNGYILL